MLKLSFYLAMDSTLLCISSLVLVSSSDGIIFFMCLTAECILAYAIILCMGTLYTFVG